MRILLDKILKIKVGCPPNFFSKLKIIHLDHEENVKKIKKTLAQAQYLGLMSFLLLFVP